MLSLPDVNSHSGGGGGDLLSFICPELGVAPLEYVGAPKSARLLSRSPEYWVHHIRREKTLSAALQLQHDAGLILSNFQMLQQLTTELNRTSSEVMWGRPRLVAVSDRRDASNNTILQSSPGGPLHDADGFMAATYRAGDTRTSAVGDAQMPACPAVTASRMYHCEPEAMLNCFYIDC